MMGNAKHGHILRQGLTHPAPSSRPSGFGDGISEIESRYRSLVGYNFRLTVGWRQIPGLFLLNTYVVERATAQPFNRVQAQQEKL